MAGKGSRRNDRGREKQGDAGGDRSRKPSVPPIIDLEATEVVGGEGDKTEAAAQATPFESDDQSDAAGTNGDDTGSPEQAASGERPRGWRIWLTPRAWSVMLKRTFSLRIRDPRWIPISAAVLAVLCVFAGGIWIGWNWGGSNQAVQLSAPTGTGDAETLDRIEADLREMAETTRNLGDQLQRLDDELAALGTQMTASDSAADMLLQEIEELRSAFDALLHAAPVSEDGEVLGTLQLQLNGLAAKLETLETAIAGLNGGAGDGLSEERLVALEAALAENAATLQSLLEIGNQGTAIDTAPLLSGLEQNLETQLAALEERIDERLGLLEIPEAQPADTSTGITVAVARLRLAIMEGRPFAAELGDMVALAPHYSELALLSPHAQSGIATRDDLSGRFAQLSDQVRAILAGEPAPQEAPDGWFASIWQRLQSLVEVRQSGELDVSGMLEHLDAAEAHVADGQFAQALDALAEMQGVADAPVGAWASAAQAHVDVNEALASIVGKALADAVDDTEGSGS